MMLGVSTLLARARRAAPLVAVLGLCLAVRLVMLSSPLARLDSDEAVTGIMAQRILDGHHLAFYAGQSYQGSAEQYLQALVLAVLPDTPFVLRLVQVGLAVLACAGVYLLARLVFRDGPRSGALRPEGRALAAAALFAVGPYFSVFFSIKSRGAYDTGLLAGLGGMVVALWTAADDRRLPGKAFLFGLAAGVGFWANWQAAYLLLPAALWLLGTLRARAIRVLPVATAGFLLGAAPSLGHLVLTGPLQASGPAVPSTVAQRAEGFFRTTIPSFMGAQEGGIKLFEIRPEIVSIVVVVVLAAAAARRFFGLSDLLLVRSGRRRPIDLLLFTAVVAPAFLIASKASAGGAYPGYLFPLYTVLPVLLAALPPGSARWGRLPVVAAGVLVLALGGQSAWMAQRQSEHQTVGYGVQTVPTERFPAVVETLRSTGVRTAYADYWVAYPLQFLAGDDMVVNPIYTERFPDLAARAAADDSPALIVPLGQPADALRGFLTDAGSTAIEHHVEGLAVFSAIQPGLRAPLPPAVFAAIHRGLD